MTTEILDEMRLHKRLIWRLFWRYHRGELAGWFVAAFLAGFGIAMLMAQKEASDDSDS